MDKSRNIFHEILRVSVDDTEYVNSEYENIPCFDVPLGNIATQILSCCPSEAVHPKKAENHAILSFNTKNKIVKMLWRRILYDEIVSF